MSIHSAKAYLKKLEIDEDFREKVMACSSSEERMKFVESEGFSFTVEDISSLKEELSDEELDTIAGGFFTACKKGGVDLVPFIACV